MIMKKGDGNMVVLAGNKDTEANEKNTPQPYQAQVPNCKNYGMPPPWDELEFICI